MRRVPFRAYVKGLRSARGLSEHSKDDEIIKKLGNQLDSFCTKTSVFRSRFQPQVLLGNNKNKKSVEQQQRQEQQLRNRLSAEERNAAPSTQSEIPKEDLEGHLDEVHILSSDTRSHLAGRGLGKIPATGLIKHYKQPYSLKIGKEKPNDNYPPLETITIESCWGDKECSTYLEMYRKKHLRRNKNKEDPKVSSYITSFTKTLMKMKDIRCSIGINTINVALRVSSMFNGKRLYAFSKTKLENLQPNEFTRSALLSIAVSFNEKSNFLKYFSEAEKLGEIRQIHHSLFIKLLVRLNRRAEAYYYFRTIEVITPLLELSIIVQGITTCTNSELVEEMWIRHGHLVDGKPGTVILQHAFLRRLSALGDLVGVDTMFSRWTGPLTVTAIEYHNSRLRSLQFHNDWDNIVSAFKQLMDDPDAVPNSRSYIIFFEACLPHCEEPGDPFVTCATEAYKDARERKIGTPPALFHSIFEIYARVQDKDSAIQLRSDMEALGVNPSRRTLVAWSQLGI